jgi:hypothetical protein
VQKVDWVGPEGAPLFLQEERRIEVSPASDSTVNIITWECRFVLPSDKPAAKITGSRYQGLGMRFVKAMDTGGQFLNATGKPGVPRNPQWKDWNVDGAAWCAYTAAVEGKLVTVAMFSDPQNARPASWFTMNDPFAYISGTLSVDREPLMLEPGKPLRLRYGIALWDGKAGEAAIAKAWKAWAGN